MLMEIGDLAAADPVMTRTSLLSEKLGGFVPYAQLATLRRKQGRAKEALELYEKAQATMPGGTGLYSMMGDIYRELGNTKRAEQLYITAQADLDKLFGKRAMLVLRLHLGLYRGLRRRQAARRRPSACSPRTSTSPSASSRSSSRREPRPTTSPTSRARRTCSTRRSAFTRRSRRAVAPPRGSR